MAALTAPTGVTQGSAGTFGIPSGTTYKVNAGTITVTNPADLPYVIGQGCVPVSPTVLTPPSGATQISAGNFQVPSGETYVVSGGTITVTNPADLPYVIFQGCVPVSPTVLTAPSGATQVSAGPLGIPSGTTYGVSSGTITVSNPADLPYVIGRGFTLGGQPASFQDVQILGSLIGVGLSDTGTADATNLLVSTQQAFSGIDWISGAATMADINSTDPNSGSTASTLTETAATSSHYTAQQFLTAVTTEVSFSFDLKQGLRTRAAMYIYDALTTTTFVTATFDLAGGVVGIAAAVGGTFTTPLATITAKSNGFYLCTVSANLVSGSGYYLAIVNADAGSGAGAANLSYAGNTSAAALTLWGAKVNTGVPSAYVPLVANAGAAASTIQQTFSLNGGTTAYWGTQTPGAYVAFDAGVPVVPTRHRFAPRPGSSIEGVFGYAPDYSAGIAGSLIQTAASGDSTFTSPTTVDTIPAQSVSSYYPRYWLNERPITGAAAARYIRFKPPTTSFGGISEWQVFAQAGTAANACPVQPVISPMGGRFPSGSTRVTMTSTVGASIYYTTDGSTPTTSSTLYTGPFTLTMGIGNTKTLKAIGYLASLSTPTSLVTISPPFCGYGLKPNDNWYDDKGNLIEAHAGSVIWDPNTSAYYWVGTFFNINNQLKGAAGSTFHEFIWQVTYLYKSTDLLNWSIAANIGVSLFSGLTLSGNPVIIIGRIHMLYNAANNNYVMWFLAASSTSLGAFFVATAPNILGPWTVNATPTSTNAADFDLMIDSDGSAYCFWRANVNGLTIRGLNSSYTDFAGASINPGASFNTREGCVAFKYPNAPGGTFFCVTSQAVPYDSSLEADLRYIYSNGANPVANTWTTLPGTSCFATDPIGTNYNGQGTFHLIPQVGIQPMIGLDYFTPNPLYNSRPVWLPMTISGNTLQIQTPTAWNPTSLVAGSISGSVATFTTAQNINLTTQGPTDWAMFGYTANAASVNRKATGGSQISALTQVGAFTLLNYNGGAGAVWLSSCNTGDGTPTATVTNEGYAVYASNTAGNGMSFTVPAGLTPHTLYVYVVISSDATHTTQGKLTATLSDASAPAYSDTTLILVNGSGNLLGAYTITYSAASAGQLLTVTWVNNVSVAAANVQIFAAALN
jgi:hypothetical protein